MKKSTAFLLYRRMNILVHYRYTSYEEHKQAGRVKNGPTFQLFCFLIIYCKIFFGVKRSCCHFKKPFTVLKNHLLSLLNYFNFYLFSKVLLLLCSELKFIFREKLKTTICRFYGNCFYRLMSIHFIPYWCPISNLCAQKTLPKSWKKLS